MITATDRKDVRKNNQILILETIRRNYRISRAEISKAIHLSAPSVSANVDQLIGIGLLKEVGEGQSVTGRKPILLEINENYRVIAAIDLSSNPIIVALGNLSGDLIDQCEVTFKGDVITQNTFDAVIEALHLLMDRQHLDARILHRICIASPGVLDEETGFFLNAPRISDYRNVNLIQMFSEEFQVETIIKNDTNLAAIGEWQNGELCECNNLIYILADTGVGAGLILNGQPYYGTNGTAGDIGYLITGLGKNVQWFDSVGSGYGILKTMTEELRGRDPEKLKELEIGENEYLDFDQCRILLEENNQVCSEVMSKALSVWGEIITNICVLLDLDTVVMGGRLSRMESVFLKPLQEIVNAHAPFHVNIIASCMDGVAALYGAISTLLEDIFLYLIPD